MARILPLAAACAALSVTSALRAGEPLQELFLPPSWDDDERRETERPLPRPSAYGQTTLGLSARLVHAGDRTGYEAIVGVTVPLDRLLGTPRGIAEPMAPAPAPATPPVATPALARACVRAAWRAAGFGDDDKLDAMASRAKASAALPELRMRVARTTDESGRLSYLDADTPHYAQTGSATYWLEARLTFRLDRLLFADEEVSLERVRIDRVEARGRVAAKVLKALFDWQRALSASADETLAPAERANATIAAMEASATLDVLTDGWFARARAGG
jgi:hypothetical protein